MKRILFVICLILCCQFILTAQPVPSDDQTAAIRQTALDYADGYYAGDTVRMARALHFDVNKAYPRFLPRSGHCALVYNTYSQLLELTRSKAGALDDTARHIQVSVILQENNIAIAKVLSANFNDYLMMAKLNGEWKIVNVLWNGGPANKARLDGFKGDQEISAVDCTVNAYQLSILSADIKRLELTISDDFSRTSIISPAAPGRQYLQRGRHNTLTENSYAFTGKVDEIQRDFKIKILDVMDAMAVARLETIPTVEYLQLYKAEGQWKIFSSLSITNPNRNFAALLPAIPGEPMPDFTLPVFNGGEFTLSKHKGKNIVLMFPRGWLGNVWCPYCPYQYIEFCELEKAQKIQKKYNMEVVFVLPYSSDRVADWFDKFPEALQTVERVKNQKANTQFQKDGAAWLNAHFPRKFEIEKGKSPMTIPVLVDADRVLSKRLKLFTNFWDNVQSEQNVASFFIIDEEGTLQYRHIGQMTEDRPSVDYILKLVKTL